MGEQESALDVLEGIDPRQVRRGGRPGWRRPMLATLTEKRFTNSDWIFEPKLDGVRVVVSRDGDERPILWSRNRRQVGASYPEVVDVVATQAPRRFVADGEIVAFEGNRTSFARLQQRIHLVDPAAVAASPIRVQLYLFDLMLLDDLDLTGLALRRRKQILRKVVNFAGPLRYSTHRNKQGEDYYAEACRRGWEGLIAKRADAAYQAGRSRDWLKFKCVSEREFVIAGFTEPSGSRRGFGALLVGWYDEHGLRYGGKVGTGYDEETLTRLRAQLDEREQPTSPFIDRVEESRVHWVRPELVGQIGFTEWTTDGRLRHPRFRGVRIDKNARDVGMEMPA